MKLINKINYFEIRKFKINLFYSYSSNLISYLRIFTISKTKPPF